MQGTWRIGEHFSSEWGSKRLRMNRKAAETSLIYQKHLIESLAKSEKAMEKKHYELKRAIEYQSSMPFINPTIG